MMNLRWFGLPLSTRCQSSSTTRGFTLVELLIAIAVLGILGAIAIPSLLNIIDETKINLLTEQIRQSLKQAQQQAISEQQTYMVRFRKTSQGLQVDYFPYEPESVLQSDVSNDMPPRPSVIPEPQTWRNLNSTISPDQLIFTMPESPNNSLIFTPEGDIQFPSKVFLALGSPDNPRVNTRRCVNVLNSESGGSYFQVDKDLACDANPNLSPFTRPAPTPESSQ
jgi:prepilin-type N-terminal cleavage/methylation domain-containing protein